MNASALNLSAFSLEQIAEALAQKLIKEAREHLDQRFKEPRKTSTTSRLTGSTSARSRPTT